MGITQVTIQPEFHKMMPNTETTDCLIRCHGEHCSSSQCCSKENFSEDTCGTTTLRAITKKQHDKKETTPAAPSISLARFAVYEECETAKRFASDARSRGSAKESPTNDNATSNDEREVRSNASDVDVVSDPITNVTDQTAAPINHRASSGMTS